MTATAELCQICHVNEVDSGRVCDDCKRMPKDDDGVIRRWLDEAEKVQAYSCEVHGVHSGSKVGRYWTKQCPQCLQDKRTAGVRRARGKQVRERAMADAPVTAITVPRMTANGTIIEVDFSGCQWVLGLIKKESSLDPAEWIKLRIVHGMLDAMNEAELKLLILAGLS
jgi:hypothetical protein